MSKAKRGMTVRGRQAMIQARADRRERHKLAQAPIPDEYRKLAFFVAWVAPGSVQPGEPRPEIVLRDEIEALGLAAIVGVGIAAVRGSRFEGVRSRNGRPTPFLLWPGYVFVGTGPGRPRLESAFGLKNLGGFVCNGGIPVRLGRTATWKLITKINHGEFDETRPGWHPDPLFRPGELVEILDGPLFSRVGVLREINVKAKGVSRAKVELIGQDGRISLAKVSVDNLRRPAA